MSHSEKLPDNCVNNEFTEYLEEEERKKNKNLQQEEDEVNLDESYSEGKVNSIDEHQRELDITDFIDYTALEYQGDIEFPITTGELTDWQEYRAREWAFQNGLLYTPPKRPPAPITQLNKRLESLEDNPIPKHVHDLFTYKFFTHYCYNVLDIITGNFTVRQTSLWMYFHIFSKLYRRHAEVRWSHIGKFTGMSPSSIERSISFLKSEGIVVENKSTIITKPSSYTIHHKSIAKPSGLVKIGNVNEHFGKDKKGEPLKLFYHKNIAMFVLWGFFTKPELQVLFLILRYTQGFFEFVNSWTLYPGHIKNYTGLEKTTIKECLLKLKHFGILEDYDLAKGIFFLNSKFYIVRKNKHGEDYKQTEAAWKKAQALFP